MRFKALVYLMLTLFCHGLFAQEETPTSVWDDDHFAAFKLRSIGPAFMAGRIADIAIDPHNENIWYVAVGSGGVWKTVNSGTTWSPIFDSQSSYSIGCVTIDPQNSKTIWVGSGENVGGRHVGFGDGIYRSQDGGGSWINMGLSKSEHISKILVHPGNSDVIWVAAQGPLWSKGGERGVYKSIDGGKNWKHVLGDDKWVGATDILIDPRNPDLLYAATWQRHRTTAAYLGGGPGSGIHKSIDGGENWEKLSSGLPESNMGKIGMALSPQKPDIIYAAITLDHRKGGFYKSTDKGVTWKKQSGAISGGTGPHYYQELYACPHNFDRVYFMDNRLQISDNGGKTFYRMNGKDKHVDNHAMAFKSTDPNYVLVGTDGGLYESFDFTASWKYISNMPITQFYKIAVDDAEPFYNVYGGTQDNSTEGGPSRTDNAQGIQNSDWKIVLNWDGHQPATEPGNPDIVYGQRQEGTLSRIDMKTGEVVDIQPQPDRAEPFERFNWDAPILVSPHDPTQLFFASYRLWRSNNRGDAWTAISGDLTKNKNRLDMPIMGQRQSFDNPWDIYAMSTYSTITSIAESPVQRDLIYIGTDDGLIQITEDGGANWRKIEVNAISRVPASAYVNDIKADLFDANTVYIAFDNHKSGDFKPYLFKSTDRGRSWKSISSNLSDRDIVWRLVQDHVNPNLLFIGTEFGVYFSVNGGVKWIQLKGNVPTISFRDLAIQRRENDLVCGSFGRSIYILDDYSALRTVSDQQLNQEATLFSTRDAWWYIQRPDLGFEPGKGSQGSAHFIAPNPPFGAVFTYYLKDDIKTKKEKRKEREKKLLKENKDIPYTGWEDLESERLEDTVKMWLSIYNAQDEIVRRLPATKKKGFHRMAWDLRHPSIQIIPWSGKKRAGGQPKGLMATPGRYSAVLSKELEGKITPLSDPQYFDVKPLHKGTLDGVSLEMVSAFWRSYEKAKQVYDASQKNLSNNKKRLQAAEVAVGRSTKNIPDLTSQLYAAKRGLQEIDKSLNGNRSRRLIGEKDRPKLGDRLFAILLTVGQSTYGPTATAEKNLNIVNQEMSSVKSALKENTGLITNLIEAIRASGGPWIEDVEVD